MEQIFTLKSSDKREKYAEFITRYNSLIADEHNRISVLANTCAALKEAFGYFWVGFYLVENDELHLGPFQGSVACYRIRKGRGVCGTAWEKGVTLVVPDVNDFPGHIACSSHSRSEIVIPMLHGGQVTGVLDIDSDQLQAFDEVDAEYLEKIILILMGTLYSQK